MGWVMNRRIVVLILSGFLMACQLINSVGGKPSGRGIVENPTAAANSENPISGSTPDQEQASTLVPLNLEETTKPFSQVPLKEWKETTYVIQGDTLPVKLEGTRNPPVVAELTQDQRNFLAANGFVIIHSGEAQFGDIRDQVSKDYGQPYYLTTDAAFHALHITFDEMLRLLEKEVLHPEVTSIISTLLDKIGAFRQKAKGTDLESDTLLAEAYLAVAFQLFNEETEFREDLANRIQPQFEQIMAGSGREKSALIPGFEDDYGAYKPVGHYAGDAKLENYFRGMTWLGRVAFKFRDAENPEFKPSKVPLIITLAVRQSEIGDKPLLENYLRLMESLTFLIGPTDDGSPLEIGALMDSVYGPNATFDDLADEQKWQTFLERSGQLPRPQINSTFVNSTKALDFERSWRLMGQRFTLDGMIFQNVIYDKVGSSEEKREFPSGLDVMSSMGSIAAMQAQNVSGETKYKNYATQIVRMQALLQNQPQQDWLNTFYSAWLYAFLPQVQAKKENFPPNMQTFAWQNKEVNSALGSWAELKHDTALYTKMPEFMGGGGPPGSPPAPGYVEANPNVFYRLSYAASAINKGLEERGYTQTAIETTEAGGGLTFSQLWEGMGQLAETYGKLGDIAVKELQGLSLTADDYSLIQSPLGPVEFFADYGKSSGQDIPLKPVPVVAAVSGAGNDVLQAGVGKVDRIYVVVPMDGRLAIAQGGVFSFYEFKQPRSDRLTDEDWQKKLDSNPPDLPAYTANYLLPGGKPVDSLAFRVGDVYLITDKGGNPPLKLRANPSRTAAVLDSLAKDTYLEITEGPEKADGFFWWKVKVFDMDATGWVAENQEWYSRAHGQ
jgi:hypothetical protein